MPFGYSIYFAERGANRVVKWTPDTGEAQVIAGAPNPSNRDHELHDPYGLAFDPGGSLLVSDKLNHRICRVHGGKLQKLTWKDPSGHRNRRPDSPGWFAPDQLYSPTSLVSEMGGVLLAAFYDDGTIYRIHPDGRLELVLGRVRNRPCFIDAPQEAVAPGEVGSTPVRGPLGLAERSDGTIFYIERRIQAVREYHPSRGVRSLFPFSRIAEWQRRSEAPEHGRLDEYHPFSPTSLALDGNETLHLCDNMHGCVLQLDLTQGTFERVLYSPRAADAAIDAGPAAVLFGPDGTAWVADSGTRSIQGYAVAADGSWTPTSAELKTVAGERLRLLAGGMGMVAGL